MFSGNTKTISIKDSDIDLDDLKCTKFHKCWKCGRVYSYIPCMTYDNDYSDYDDDLYYKCPECGTKYHVPDNINFIGCFIKNIIEKFSRHEQDKKKVH